MSGDLHTPTNAGPEPDSSYGTSAGPAGVDAAGDRPELIVGAAFAGGLVLATILKRLGRE